MDSAVLLHVPVMECALLQKRAIVLEDGMALPAILLFILLHTAIMENALVQMVSEWIV